MAHPYARGEKTEAQSAKHPMQGQHDQSKQYFLLRVFTKLEQPY
jgi:hypothetical protein